MQKTLPPKSVKLEIKGTIYDVPFPNTGQFLDIYALKGKIVDNYQSFVTSTDYEISYAKALIDMVATFNTLIPELKKDLNVEAILGLSMIESRELLDPYVAVYLPFFNSWMEVITKIKSKTEEKKVA